MLIAWARPRDPDDPETPDPSDDLPAIEEASETAGPPESLETLPPLSTQPGAPQLLNSAQAIRLLDEVTGINVRIGEMVVAELGLQMDRFPDEAHLSSWLGLCPAAKNSREQTAQHQDGQREPMAAPGPH